jgi:hypothetical protein
MYCRRCEQTLVTDSRERCDACGSTDVVLAGSRDAAPAVPEADELARLVAEKRAEPPKQYSSGLFGGIEQIMDTAGAAPDVGNLSDAEARRHARYHYRIVTAGCVCAALGAIFGIVAAVGVVADPKPSPTRGVLLAPVMFGAGGFAFGMSLTCLFAPTAFLTGPVGRPWMNMIGTRSPTVARVACALFGLIVTAPLVALGALVALGR